MSHWDSFGTGSVWLFKCDKMILVTTVVERGLNYLIINIKGSELQETTACHAEENAFLDEYLDKKKTLINWKSQLSHITDINIPCYDD